MYFLLLLLFLHISIENEDHFLYHTSEKKDFQKGRQKECFVMENGIWMNRVRRILNNSDIDDDYLMRILVFVARGSGYSDFIGNREAIEKLFQEGKRRFQDLSSLLERLEKLSLYNFDLGEKIVPIYQSEIKSPFFTAKAKKREDWRFVSCVDGIRRLFNDGFINEEEAFLLCDRAGFRLKNLHKERFTGVLGKPKYQRGERVSFTINGQTKQGVVAVVDSHGTFEQDLEPSYDILVKEENTLYKHIRETFVASSKE